MKFLSRFTALLFTTMAALFISVLFGAAPALVVGVLVVLSFVLPSPKGVLSMAVTREIWTQDIIDNLFKNNDFAKRAFSEDQYVLEGKVVHIPQAGAPSAVNKNVTQFPVTAVKRADTDLTYALDTYYTTPRHIERIEDYELAYDKRQSALGEDEQALIQAAMDGLMFRWAPGAANVIPTVGAARVASEAGATGNRKKLTKDCFGPIKVQMDRANIPGSRCAVLTADHYQDLLDSFSDVERTNFHQLADMTNGIIGKYLNIDILMRSTALRYRKVGGVWTAVDEQDPDFAESDQTADSAASIFYNDLSVTRALGTTQMFDGANRPEYYGDIFSFILRMGGRIRRAAGVFAVVEDAAA